MKFLNFSEFLGLTIPQLVELLKVEFKLQSVSEDNWKYLLSQFKQLDPEFTFGKLNGPALIKGYKNRLFSWAPLKKVINVDMNDVDARIYCTNQQLLNSTLLDGRLVVLPDNSLLALQLIGSHGRGGVNQADLAHLMFCDSKSVFHWLKPLMLNDLIIRTPISISKCFTYQITLAHYEDEELDGNEGGLSKNLSSVEIRQLIVDILSKAPGNCLCSRETFSACGIHRSQIKGFRRAAVRLQEMGWIQISIERQLFCQDLRVFRLLRRGDVKRTEIKVQPVKEISGKSWF